MTLAQELAKLNQPAPRSIDPEAFDAPDALDAASASASTSAPSHTDPAEEKPLLSTPGKLLRGIDLEDAKYRGRVVKRQDIEESKSDSELDEDEDGDVSSESEDGDGSHVEKKKVGKEETMKKMVEADSDAAADDDDDGEEEKDGAEGFRVMKKVERGSDSSPERTKVQLKQWGDLVGVRIRLQPLLLQVLDLPRDASLPLQNTYDTLRGCLADLVEIRNHAVSQPTSYFNQGYKQKLKRCRTEAGLDSQSTSVEGVWKGVAGENEVTQAFCDEVFDRWHDRSVHALGISGKKLKALNQPISFQVDQVIRSGKEVVQRSQMRDSKHDPEIYNDTDFYQQLLKEYISTAGHSNTHTTEEAMKGGKKLKRSKKKGVDVRASKGRKIRYTVHDKLVNFVAPNPSPQSRLNVDQLMSSLFAE